MVGKCVASGSSSIGATTALPPATGSAIGGGGTRSLVGSLFGRGGGVDARAAGGGVARATAVAVPAGISGMSSWKLLEAAWAAAAGLAAIGLDVEPSVKRNS